MNTSTIFHGSFYLNAYPKEFDRIDENYVRNKDQKCSFTVIHLIFLAKLLVLKLLRVNT
jgi:hypothetical protein